MKIFWRSWSPLEAQFELDLISKLPLQNQWLNGHTESNWTRNDIRFTTNGGEYLHGANLKQVSWFAESFVYLQDEYLKYKDDKRFDLRFHFNPHFAQMEKSIQLPIYAWWERELELFKNTIDNKHPEFVFGMVTGKKSPKNNIPSYYGWFRDEVIKAAKDRSFRYYGYGWSREDKNCGGEIYIDGNRSSPVKFHDARKLMTKAKFVFALENTHDEHYSLNYVTEKIFHGFLSASVPIYLGAWNVKSIIPENLFIDIRDFNYNLLSVMDFCEKMPEREYKDYLERIGEFLEGKGKAFTGENRFLQIDKILTEWNKNYL